METSMLSAAGSAFLILMDPSRILILFGGVGFILGSIIERYLFISIQRYGVDWFARPVVIFFIGISALAILRPFLQVVKHHGGLGRMLSGYGKPTFRATDLFYVMFVAVVGAMMRGSGISAPKSFQ